MDKFSYLGNGDVSAIEELYQAYKRDQQSVDKEWQGFFAGFDFFSTEL